MTQSAPILNDPSEEIQSANRFSGWLRKTRDVLLPERCYVCGEIVSGGGGLCAPCWEKITFVTAPLCWRCGRPYEFEIPGKQQCAACLRRPPVYDKARSCMVYDDGSRSLVLAFKHADRVDMAPVLAGWLQRAGADVIGAAQLITPVPLHWTRLWSRRFNQSAELARHLARLAGKTYAPEIIRRKRRTPSQARLRAGARAKNVRGAFSVPKKSARRITGKRILLIDDVLTTGSTLNACAGVLLWAGAEAVDVLTLARVVRAERD